MIWVISLQWVCWYFLVLCTSLTVNQSCREAIICRNRGEELAVWIPLSLKQENSPGFSRALNWACVSGCTLTCVWVYLAYSHAQFSKWSERWFSLSLSPFVTLHTLWWSLRVIVHLALSCTMLHAPFSHWTLSVYVA